MGNKKLNNLLNIWQDNKIESIQDVCCQVYNGTGVIQLVDFQFSRFFFSSERLVSISLVNAFFRFSSICITRII